MKTLTTLIGIIAPATAFAAANTPEANDGIFVWIFLGFFALIVVGQIVPALLLLSGFVKGILAKTEKKVAVKS